MAFIRSLARYGKSLLVGAGITYGVLWASGLDESIPTKYFEIKSSRLAREGTALVPVYDSDGLDSLVLTNNTPEHPELTQIPPLELHHLYEDRFTATFPDLRSGHYVFVATVQGDRGKVTMKAFPVDIKNPGGGVSSLYGKEAVIDNKHFPDGKERFRLGNH